MGTTGVKKRPPHRWATGVSYMGSFSVVKKKTLAIYEKAG